ncbi:MAG: ammonium transporter [Planctomycetota bacterium]
MAVRKAAVGLFSFLFVILLCCSGSVDAAEEAALKADAVQGNLNTVWVCIAAFLVFFMQAGFALVESGFTRAKNACNIMMKNLMDFSVGTMAWFVCGFGLMFGGGSRFLGLEGGFLGEGIEVVNGDLGWTFWLFQCVFAGTAATIVSGAMAGRTKFSGYLSYSVFICAFIYPVSGHWIWGDGGWLAEMGFVDFAGSTVVHSCGAWLALAGAYILGPRSGKYGSDGKSKAIPGHNIPLAALGVFILWFGWFGFNPGSTVEAVSDIGYIAVTTNLAAAAGAITAMLSVWIKYGKPDISMSLNGVLGGLVAITAGCASVTPLGAIIIGGLAGILVVIAVEFIDKVLKIDDPVGAVSVHGVCGAWGTTALAFFLKEGAEASVLTQLIGAAAMFVWAFGLGLGLFYIINKVVGLRVDRTEELRGLDIEEHGNEAYPSFQVFVTQ